MTRKPWLTLLLFLLVSCNHADETHTSIADHDYLNDFPALSDQGLVNIVIEIPAGSNDKWEVNKESGAIEWEVVGDSLRVVRYLPYPANYGMVPQTWLDPEQGGDNDPLDIFLLGPVQKRGSVVEGKIIGIIKMLDRGESDDKLIAVDPNSWFYGISNIEELNHQYPGVLEILSTWLVNYKGEGVVDLLGVTDAEEAEMILKQSSDSYQEKSN